jgi:carboxypeptidase PM20D1
MKKTLVIIFILFLLFTFYLLYNTLTFKSVQVNHNPIELFEINHTSIQNFSNSIQIKTISPENKKDFDSISFLKFSSFLQKTYPLTDSILEKQTFNSFSFLYKWKGSNIRLKPIVLMAHLDVVPVIDENLSDWKKNPFGGDIINDTIWGRGTIDDKISVISIMESIEMLLIKGFIPKRTIYISFGHDEEIGGLNGAKTIANYLEKQNIKAEFILDEGGTITQEMIPGIKKDVALIGIAEKGFLSLELSVKLNGGHSSMPDKETAIDVLCGAISTLKNNRFPPVISPPIKQFIKNLGPEMPFMTKLAFANSSIFKSLIIATYEKSASGNALIRTTTAPTIFTSGVKENIIPQFASATINFRIIPGTNITSVIKYVSQNINDERIKIKVNTFNSEPSKVSSTKSFGYKTIRKTIAQIYPKTLISPYLVIGATDSRHFENISDDIYRFLPIKLNKKNIKSFHGINESISINDFKNSIHFYTQLIKNSSSY